MPPFRFRLQRILDWQQRASQMEEEKLRYRLAELAETRQSLAQLAELSAAAERDFVSQHSLAPADFRALAEFRRKTIAGRQALEREEVERQKAADEQRLKVLGERRRLRIFDKLRERALAEHTREASRQLEELGLESFLARRS